MQQSFSSVLPYSIEFPFANFRDSEIRKMIHDKNLSTLDLTFVSF